jgi:probable HAF family extracellular repeat protein
MRDLGTLGGNDAQVFPGSINDRGEVTGFSYTNSIPNASTGFPTFHPFLWDGNRMVDLSSLGGDEGMPFVLNNRGQVVGDANLQGDMAYHPFLWSNGVLKDLGTFEGTNGDANSINDSGQVVGDANLEGDQVRHGALWDRGKMVDLGVLPGDRCSTAWSINSAGQVVGASGQCGAGQRAFIWEGGEIANLNDLVFPKSDVILRVPNVISDDGKIGVNGLPPGCDNVDVCGHPYLLIPDGDCDDDLSARITADQNRPADTLPLVAAHNSQTIGTDAKKAAAYRLRERMLQKQRNIKGG